MTLQTTPPISMANIATELGVGLPLSLTASNARTLAGIASGPISILDFLGKSSAIISGNMIVGTTGDQVYYGFSDGSFDFDPDEAGQVFGSISVAAAGVIFCFVGVLFDVVRTSFVCSNGGLEGKTITVTSVASGSSQSEPMGPAQDQGGGVYEYNNSLSIFYGPGNMGASFDVTIT